MNQSEESNSYFAENAPSPEESKEMLNSLAKGVADYIRQQQPEAFHWPPSKLVIAGVERIQAVQYFDINGQGSGYATDNSVPMVARKTLILRVFPAHTGLLPLFGNVTGTVSYRRWQWPATFTNFPDLSPINASIGARPAGAIDRGNGDHSLNFRVPASNCQGVVQFTVTVYSTANPSFKSDPISFWLVFQQVPRPRIRGVLIHYTGLGMDIAAPSGIDLINTLAWVGRVYPIRGFYYTGCDVIDFNGDLTVGGGGGCGTGWNQLWSMLVNMRSASGTNDTYVGLLPSGVPTSGVIGCGGGGVAIGYEGDGSTMAQEIAHAYGRMHAPCGNPGNVDPTYPTYNSFPSGSIGEYGFDNVTSQVHSPNNTYDYMSYCGPVWTSPHTYIGIKNGLPSGMAAAHPNRPQVRDVEREYLYLNFRMDRKGAVQLLSSYHLHGPAPAPEPGPRSPVSCDLLDADENILESHHCHFSNPHYEPDDPFIDFHEVVPWNDAINSIAFLRHGEVAETIRLAKESPKLDVAEPKTADRRNDLMRLEWKGSHPELQTSYLIRFTNDGGKTWRAIAANLTETRLLVNQDLLPGGDDCRFQVVASAGIRTTIAETKRIKLPRKPTQAYILSPENDSVYNSGDSIVLRGGGFSPDYLTSDLEDVVWASNRDGPLGVGYEVITESLSPGRHVISLSVPDGEGGEATARVTIQVMPRE